MRFRSEMEDTFAGKVVAALRKEFGGHDVVKKINVWQIESNNKIV